MGGERIASSRAVADFGEGYIYTCTIIYNVYHSTYYVAAQVITLVLVRFERPCLHKVVVPVTSSRSIRNHVGNALSPTSGWASAQTVGFSVYDGVSQPQPMPHTLMSAFSPAALPNTEICESPGARGSPTHASVPAQRPPCTKKSASERSGRMRTLSSVSSNSGVGLAGGRG